MYQLSLPHAVYLFLFKVFETTSCGETLSIIFTAQSLLFLIFNIYRFKMKLTLKSYHCIIRGRR